MPGFEKIDLDLKNDTIISQPTMARKKRKTWQSPKNLKLIGGIAAAVVLFVVFGLILPLLSVVKSAKTTFAQTKVLSAAFKQQNIEVASVEIGKTQVALADTREKMKMLGYMHFIPVVNFYYDDATHLLNAGDEGLKAGAIVIESLKPYADVLGLKGEGSFVGGSAEDRIKTAVLSLGHITPRIDEIADRLVKVRTEIEQVKTSHYPSFLFGKKINTQLTQVKELTDQGVAFVDEARPLVKVLPSLLGEKEDKRYLVLFQNDKELRPTGGFITAYAIFRLDKGVIHLERSDDIYPIDDSIPNKPKAPASILKYLPKVPTLNLRDSNLSPDFIESMKSFNSLYDRASGSVDVDGIIAIDTGVLVSTIKILDDQITVQGQTYTTKPDQRCGGCPQVIYELEDNISRPVNFVRTDRKGLLGDMLTSLMSKALSSSPKIYWGPLFQSMLAQTHQKHIMFYLYDKEAQAGVEALRAAGKIEPFEGDYLHINEANFGGAKSNLFVDEAVTAEYNISNGTITKTVTIEYKNTYPPSDCNLERGGLCLNAELRDWIRVYVPKGSELVDSKGSEVKLTTSEDLGKTVFEGFLTVRPLGKTTFTLTYTLPFKVEGNQLPVLIQKQPGTYGFPYTIKVNGRTVEKFDLLTDKELKLKV